MSNLNKRGHLVVGFLLGAVVSLSAQFLLTHHQVVVKESCKWSDEANGLMCDTKWVKNNG